jgi:hypothetical protein
MQTGQGKPGHSRALFDNRIDTNELVNFASQVPDPKWCDVVNPELG